MLAQAHNELAFDPPRHGRAKLGFLDTMKQHVNNDPASENASLVLHANLGIAKVKLAKGRRKDQRGSVKDAEKMCRQILELRRQRGFPHGIMDCETEAVLAQVLEDENDERKLAEAASHGEAAMYEFLKLNGGSSLAYLHAIRRLSSVHEKLNRLDHAEKGLKGVVMGYTKTLGEHHSETLGARLRLGRLHLQQRRLEDAELACRLAHMGFDETHGPQARQTVEAALALDDVGDQRNVSRYG